ncbi:MAG: methyl-accepting chemotaxis protein, partial [Microcoleaceae cyanobacterium]
QSTAGEMIAKEAIRLNSLINNITKAMNEQATAANQINIAVENMHQQSEQVAKAMSEQSRSTKDTYNAIQNITKQINLITRANEEHSGAAVNILDWVAQTRNITEANVRGVEDSRQETSTLLERARNLVAIMDRLTS